MSEPDFDQPPVVRLRVRDDLPWDPAAWPFTIPAVAQVMAAGGLDLAPGVTFLVGENGSGKSTLVEAIAIAFGFAPEGGSRSSRHSTRPTESPLSDHLAVQRGVGGARWGYFLRAETMHSFYTYLEQAVPGGPNEPRFHELSHGESFLAILDTRFDQKGFYCLDEPEAALSFSSTLSLLARFDAIAASGGQVVCATHSPVLAALPGARILEVGEWGLRDAQWDDLELVRHWRSFLDSPERYLRHLLA